MLKFVVEHKLVELHQIVQFISKFFGFSPRESSLRAKETVGILEQKRFVKCVRADNQIVSVAITAEGIASIVIPPRLVKVVKKKSDIALEHRESATAVNVTSTLPVQNHHRHKVRIHKKGLARHRRLAFEKGDRNEARLSSLASRLVDVLKREFREVVLGGQCERSGRHNPDMGKIDLGDKHGEDVVIRLQTLSDDKLPQQHRIIYDAKSSKRTADIANRNILRFGLNEGQEDAKLKKAIVSSDRRSNSEIINEILDDLVRVAVLPRGLNTDRVLAHFW